MYVLCIIYVYIVNFSDCILIQVLDVVRAAESLVSKSNSPVDIVVPPKSPGGTKDLKTTTIVMSKHTLASQNPNVSIISVSSY